MKTMVQMVIYLQIFQEVVILLKPILLHQVIGAVLNMEYMEVGGEMLISSLGKIQLIQVGFGL